MSKWISLRRYVTRSQVELRERQEDTRHFPPKGQLCDRGTAMFHGDGFKVCSYAGTSPENGEWVWALSLYATLINEHDTLKC